MVSYLIDQIRSRYTMTCIDVLTVFINVITFAECKKDFVLFLDT